MPFRLNGSYESLDAGQLADAMDDFTGGMTEYYALGSAATGQNKGLPPNLDDQLIKAYERHSLISAGILVWYKINSDDLNNDYFTELK